MQELSTIVFSGIFVLRDGISEEEFLPTLRAFYEHLIEKGFASDYRLMRRHSLEGFGKTFPDFEYRGELIYPNFESAAYEYVKRNAEPIGSLHYAMNSKVKRGADFFLEQCIARK